MIYYFSGTGNSKYIAQNIAENNGTNIIAIQDVIKNKELFNVNDELIGFVFPVYAWAPPKIFIEFIKSFDFSNASYIFAVCTCGDEAGYAMKILQKNCAKKIDSFFFCYYA